MPVITDSKKYEENYRKRLLGMSMELRSMIDHASSIAINEFGRPSLLDAKGMTTFVPESVKHRK